MTTFQTSMFCIGVTLSLIVLFCIASVFVLLIGDYIKKLIGGIKWFGRKMDELREENKRLKSEIESMKNNK